ncbi:hypothetical protein DH09_17975 [Bacillaceae bacterium JMAK1]|nr:hypothetical protein DH09_17975 [Bacillaceae bacterium JMAK1]
MTLNHDEHRFVGRFIVTERTLMIGTKDGDCKAGADVALVPGVQASDCSGNHGSSLFYQKKNGRSMTFELPFFRWRLFQWPLLAQGFSTV